jgi:uncharacterized protein YcfL
MRMMMLLAVSMLMVGCTTQEGAPVVGDSVAVDTVRTTADSVPAADSVADSTQH